MHVFERWTFGTISGFVTSCLCAGLLVGPVTGCDGEKKEEDREDLDAFAKTALGEGEDEATKAARLADEKARKEAFAKRKAEEQAEQKKYDEVLATYAVLPEDMPKDVEQACKDVLPAYETWIKTQFADDAGAQMNYFDNKSKIWGDLRGKCMKIDSLEAAACQVNVLSQTPAGMAGKGKDLMSACVEKFAPEAYEKVAAEEAALQGKAGADADQAG